MKKKTLFAALLISVCSTNAFAQSLQNIKLESPDMHRGSSLMEALSNRKSVREFSHKDLTQQDLSDLLWAAAGINRPDGKRTSPTARNMQEIDLYVFNAKGVYLYDHKTHSLRPMVSGDHRNLIAAGQSFVTTAPVSILMVADLERYGKADIHAQIMGSVDVGIVSQNINLFCAANGLCTVPRGTMNQEKIKELLHLSDSALPILNNPVGYKK